MLNELPLLPTDPIFGLAMRARADKNPNKVDLTIGIYMDQRGLCPVLEAVQQAQVKLIEQETTKAYMSPLGDENFNAGIRDLLLGQQSELLKDQRVSSIQTPGGCGALRIAAEIVNTARAGAKVWVSDPTWPNHVPLMQGAGLNIVKYRYYDPAKHNVNFDGMVEDLKQAGPEDVVLLHGCCHNPSGADLSQEQWASIAKLAQQNGFLPLVDIAYQGLGSNLDDDAQGLRLLAQSVPK